MNSVQTSKMPGFLLVGSYTLSFLKAMDATRFFSSADLTLFLLHVTDISHDVINGVYDCFYLQSLSNFEYCCNVNCSD